MRRRPLGAAMVVAPAVLLCAVLPRSASSDAATMRIDARPGDVVFFRTTTWRGRLVRLLERNDGDFAHVGIVVEAARGPVTIAHAAPDGDAVVRIDSLASLLARDDISSAELRRPRVSAGEAARAARIARMYAERRTPFDHELRLDDDHSVYCTELIWLAYRGHALATARPEGILFPSDLLRSPLFAYRPEPFP